MFKKGALKSEYSNRDWCHHQRFQVFALRFGLSPGTLPVDMGEVLMTLRPIMEPIDRAWSKTFQDQNFFKVLV